ncbi:MAG: HAMP domain-containing protein [Deltaproteobacteria bacterium]|nr:HAMP domain-containing protein [Deltaproteobacteria bacterium]
MRILDKAIMSHLLVAVPPAVLLGWMVASINEGALRYEAQLLHLSTAERMKEALADQTRDAVDQLLHAERILAIEALPLSDRQDLLRAMVASGGLPHVLVYRPDGAFDAAIRAKDDEVPRADLPEATRARADERGFGVGPVDDAGLVAVAVPWTLGETRLGYLGTTVEPASLAAEASALATTYLGEGGRVEVIDGRGRRLLASHDVHEGEGLGGTPFEGLTFSGDGQGLGALAAGISKRFVDAAGEERLAAVVSDPDLGWVVGTSRPVKVAFESIDRVHQRVGLMALAAALAAGLVGLLLARQISSPIQALSAAVRRAAQAGFSAVAPGRGGGEVAELTESFNAAVSELDRYRTQLRQTTQLRLRLSRMVSSAAVHEALASADEALGEVEEQQVTLLYADIILPAGGLDTEHLVTALSEFFGAAHATMRRHKGAVDRFSGDAVMGIFVGPAPRDAVAAARELVADAAAVSERWQAHLGGAIAASVGVVTGPGRLQRTPERGELSVSGPLVERSAAAQGLAEAGQVLLDEATRGAAAPDAAPHDGEGGPWFALG